MEVKVHACGITLQIIILHVGVRLSGVRRSAQVHATGGAAAHRDGRGQPQLRLPLRRARPGGPVPHHHHQRSPAAGERRHLNIHMHLSHQLHSLCLHRICFDHAAPRRALI